MDTFTLHIKRPEVVARAPAKKRGASEEEVEEKVEAAPVEEGEKRAVVFAREGEEGSRKRPKHVSARTYSNFHLSAQELLSKEKKKGLDDEKPAEAEKIDDKSVDSEAHVDRFAEAGLSRKLAGACVKVGFVEPTAVQKAAIKTLSAKGREKSVLVVAPTGSGKTLAYALPLLDSLVGRSRSQGIGAVIVAPTRELCQQICGATTKIGRIFDVGIVVGAVTGGERRKSEKARLRKGLVIICATPGRFIDHLKSTESLAQGFHTSSSRGQDHSGGGGNKKNNNLDWFVLDEVDRLLDLGFGPQIDEIALLLDLKERRRTMNGGVVLVTATVDAKLKNLAQKHLGDDYAIVEAPRKNSSSTEEVVLLENDEKLFSSFVMPETLGLEFAVITLKLRLAALAAMCRRRQDAKTLVFVSTCASAEFHHKLFDAESLLVLGEAERPVFRLHGHLDKFDRKLAYDAFCSAAPNAILFATDVAARGLDFDKAKVDWVLHLDCPRDVSSFVHRSGRAARAGRRGLATLFLLPSEKGPYLQALEKSSIPKPDRVGIPQTLFKNDLEASNFMKTLQDATKQDAELLHRARDAFTAHLRAYASSSGSSQQRRRNRDQDDATLEKGEERKKDDNVDDLLSAAFHLRKLHLGHAAKAFALTETPKTVALHQKKHQASQKKKAKQALPKRTKPTTINHTTRVANGAKRQKDDLSHLDRRGQKRLKPVLMPMHHLSQNGLSGKQKKQKKPIAPPSFFVSEFG